MDKSALQYSLDQRVYWIY